MPDKLVQAAEPALDVLAQTVLGSVLVVVLIVAVAAIYTLIKVQNARVEDQKEMSERLERTNAKMVDAFSGFQTALTGLEKAEDTSQQAIQFLRDQVVGLSTRIDGCPRRG
jgi:predicted lipoprotein